jgi:hypothetical protein
MSSDDSYLSAFAKVKFGCKFRDNACKITSFVCEKWISVNGSDFNNLQYSESWGFPDQIYDGINLTS